MRSSTHTDADDFGERYVVRRDRVDAAYDRMWTLTAQRHSAAEMRAAAARLSEAVRVATAAVLNELKAGAPAADRPRRRWRRRKVSNAPSPAERPWSAELMRLTGIEVWLRRTTLDDPGVHVPMTVRVGNYAALGPHIAGLGFDSGDARLGEPRIGVDLQAVLDRTDRPPPTAASAVPAAAHSGAVAAPRAA